MTPEEILKKHYGLDFEESFTGYELQHMKEAMIEYAESLQIDIQILKQINFDLANEVSTFKKLCKMASVPKILIEYPDLLNGQPTKEDLSWANAVLRRYINEI